MLKVTGGGTSAGAVRAHFAYVSRRGRLDMETSEGEWVGTDQHKALIDSWDLDLVRGQYRKPAPGQPAIRPAKLVHNIILGMPSPTPPDKVMSAARVFAEKQFALHRYALVLHTDQRHPHVHLVVRAEDDRGKRLHIDKAMLRGRQPLAADALMPLNELTALWLSSTWRAAWLSGQKSNSRDFAL